MILIYNELGQLMVKDMIDVPQVVDVVVVGIIVGKKVEVSLRLFDIFERKRVFIFLLES